jgi:hypothetical protein
LFFPRKETSMSTVSSKASRFRRLWKPALVTGISGTGTILWFEEAMEFIGVIVLVILGALICLFDHFVFKSCLPKLQDREATTKGNQK